MAKYLDPKAHVTFKKVFGEHEVSQDLLDNPQTGQALELVRESGMNDAERAAYEGFWDRVSIETTKKNYYAAKDAKLSETEARLNAAEAKLGETEVRLGETEARLGETEVRLGEAEAKLDAAEAERDAAVEKLRQTARSLKAMNLAVEQVGLATGLAADEIAALQEGTAALKDELQRPQMKGKS